MSGSNDGGDGGGPHTVDSALAELNRKHRRRPAQDRAAKRLDPPARSNSPAGQDAPAAAPARAGRQPAAAGNGAAEPDLPSPFTEPGADRDASRLDRAEPDQDTSRLDEPDRDASRLDEPGLEQDEPGEEGGEPETYYSLVLDGRPVQVPASELIAGYLRGQDYSRKTQGLTQQQEQFAAAFQQFDQARTKLEQRLTQFTAGADAEFSQPIDWVKLAQTDPMGWAEKRARFDALQEARNEQQRLANLRTQEDAARKQQMLEAGNQYLSRAIPGWKDTATRTRLQGELKELLTAVGYTPQELATDILDPRQVVILHDALRYRQMVARKVTPAPPEQQRPLERGNTPPAQPTRRVQAAESAFQEKSSVDNAMAVLKAREAARRRAH